MKYNKNEVTGKMRDRIILQNVNRSRSLTGFASESWADVATIWAFAESKLPGSNETIIEGKNTAKNICDFTIRYISSITEESRVVFKNKIYQVKNIKISHDRRFISFQGVYYDSYSTVFGLQSCSASLLAQSSLSAALMRVIKYQSSLNAFGSVTADINFVHKVASSLNANASLIGDINFVQNMQAALLTSSSVTGNIIITKFVQASLTGAGTTAADLTVGVAFDADAQAFINAAAITDATQKSAINTLVTSLKSNGLWTKMKAIYPFVGGTASTHKFNLKDPRDLNAAYRIVFSGGWTHDNLNGITPNGINATGDTFYLGSGVDNNFALSYYTKTNIMQPNTPGLYTFGSSTSSLQTYCIIINRTNNNLASIMGRETSVAIKNYNNVAQVGLFTGSRTSSSLLKVYKNNILEDTNTVEQAGSWSTRNVFFGQPSLLAYTTMNCQFASISEGLTDTDVVNLYSVVQAYQITLNRQV